MNMVNSVKKKLLIGLKKKVPFFEPSNIDLHYINKGSSKSLTPENYLKIIYQRFYNGQSVEDLVPSEDLNFCESWVPYQKGKTHLGLYNLYHNNYGIKDPLYTRISVISHEKVLNSKSFILKPKEAKLIDVSTLFDNEDGSLLVQVFHPRVKVILNQFRYFGFYGDEKGNILSGVHSMPIPSRKGYIGLNKPKFRSYSWKESQTQYESFSEHNIPGVINEEFGYFETQKDLKGIGYITIKDKDQNITSIWHDGPTPHSNKISDQQGEQIGKVKTSTFVPDFKLNAPHIFIHEDQVGLKSKEFEITLFKENPDSPIAKKSFTFDGKFITIDTSKVSEFGSIEGSINIAVHFKEDLSQFQSVPNFYCHFYFTNKGHPSDQVHSQATFGYKNNPFKSLNKFRCNKFAPAVINSKHSNFYSISNIGPNKENAAKDLKVRVYSSEGKEYITYLSVPAKGLLNFSFDELGLNIENGYATVIIEDEYTNYNANWFVLNKETGSVATDHFTGG